MQVINQNEGLQQQQPIYKKKNKSWVLIEGLKPQHVANQITQWPFLHEIYKQNEAKDQWRLIESIMRVPSPSDGPGFIYGFMDQKQNAVSDVPYWIKMGRTKLKIPQQRIHQWEKEDKKEFTEIFTVRSPYNIKLEYMVHALFAYARKPRMVGDQMRKEWFYFERETLNCAAVTILNNIMQKLHRKFLTKEMIGEEGSLEPINRTLFQLSHRMHGLNKQIDGLAIALSQNMAESIDSIKTDFCIGTKNLTNCFNSSNNLKEALTKVDQKPSIKNQLQQFIRKWESTIQSVQRIKETYGMFEDGLFISLGGKAQEYAKQKISESRERDEKQSEVGSPKNPESKGIKINYQQLRTIQKIKGSRSNKNRDKNRSTTHKKQYNIRQIAYQRKDYQRSTDKTDVQKPTTGLQILGISGMILTKSPFNYPGTIRL